MYWALATIFLSHILIAWRSASAVVVVAVAVFPICAVLCAGSQQPGSNFTHEFASKWITVTGFCEELEQVTELGLHQLPGAEVFWLILLTGSVLESGEGKSEHLHPTLWFSHPLEGCKVLSSPAHRPPPTLHTNRQDLWFLRKCATFLSDVVFTFYSN